MHYISSPKGSKAKSADKNKVSKTVSEDVLDASYFLANPILYKILAASLSLLSINKDQVFNTSDISQYLQNGYSTEDIFVIHKSTTAPYLQTNTFSKRPNIIQLNVGSFGLDSDNNEIDENYYNLGKKLITYLQSQKDKALIFSLQDVPNDQPLWEQMNLEGYSVYWYPTNHYSEGKYKTRPDTGNAILINNNLQGYKLVLDNSFIKYHSSQIPDYSDYKKESSEFDLIQISSTLYSVFRNEQSKEIFLVSTTHISPFITQSKRLEIIKSITETAKELHLQLNLSYSGYNIIHRFAGDFNLYGVDSDKGPFGLPANTFAFLSSAVDAVVTGFRPLKLLKLQNPFVEGKNYLHRDERNKIKDIVETLGFKLMPDIASSNYSIKFPLSKYAPKLLKPIFKGAKAVWLLDYVYVPAHEIGVVSYLDLEPFGHTDHKSLVVSL